MGKSQRTIKVINNEQGNILNNVDKKPNEIRGREKTTRKPDP